MITRDDIILIGLVIARANNHPAPQDYADEVVGHFDHANDVVVALPPEVIADK